jgi:septum site-determining protein MinD
MGKSIIISSAKGGVGKTNTVINLGIALSELGKDVAIIDGSLTTPDISLYLGIPFHVRGLNHILKENSHLESSTFNHKSGARIIPGNVHMDVLKEFEGGKFPKLLERLKKEHDFVLVDCAAGLGREAISAIKHCDQMLTIINPELASIVNASKTIQLAKEHKVKPIGVILNRVGRFKQEFKEKDIEPLLHKVKVIGNIPEDKKVAIALKNSEAIVNYFPKSKVSKELRNIAFKMSGKRKKQQESFLQNLKNLFFN